MLNLIAQSDPSVLQRLAPTEWAMVAVFTVGVVTWGFLMRKAASASLEGSFMAGRKVPGWVASLSTVATNLNANDFIGGAGMLYGFGVIWAHGSWVNGLALLLVSLFLVQKLRRLNVFTLGGWLEKRFSFSVGMLYSIIWSVVWMLFNLGLYLYAGALVLNTLVGWDLYTCIVALSIIAAFYTLIGGFGAVVATDVLQMALMFFPFIFLGAAVWYDIGGVWNLAEMLPPEKATFWMGSTEFGPLSIMLAGTFFMGMSYWSTEAQIIQRPLSSRDEQAAMVGYMGATFWLSILSPLLIGVPALAAIAYFPNLPDNDLAMPSLIQKFLPPGLYGVTIVGLMAGVFSSADSQINAFCTMFTNDVYKRLIRRNKPDQHYLNASRIFGVLFTLAAIGTAFIVSTNSKGMMLFAVSILATIMPPFAAVTMLGAMTQKVNRYGALAGVLVGLGIGVLMVVITLFELEPLNTMIISVAPETLFLRNMVNFLVSGIVCVLVSAATGGPKVVEAHQRIDIGIRLSPYMMKAGIGLAIGLLGIAVFWSVFFPG